MTFRRHRMRPSSFVEDRDDFFSLRRPQLGEPQVPVVGPETSAPTSSCRTHYDALSSTTDRRAHRPGVHPRGRSVPDTPMILLTGPSIHTTARLRQVPRTSEKGAITPELLDRSIRYACKNARRRAI